MNDGRQTQQEDIEWPPSPSLPPPRRLEPEPLLIRVSVRMVAFIDAGVSVILSGLAYLRLPKGHNLPYWSDIVAEGLVPGLFLFGVHLWLRRAWTKRHMEESA